MEQKETRLFDEALSSDVIVKRTSEKDIIRVATQLHNVKTGGLSKTPRCCFLVRMIRIRMKSAVCLGADVVRCAACTQDLEKTAGAGIKNEAAARH